MIKGFVKSSGVSEVLSTAYKSGQNVILYGPGGYGKSEMTLAFLRQIGARKDQITIKSLSVGTSVDDLFGGINMKILQEEGRLEYNLQDSIFSTPYLVLEEAFDAPLRVLEALKDTLTSGWVRNGSQQWEVHTKFIIVCTNRSKEELVEDESSKALMERFPLSLKVNWSSHDWEDYKELIQCIFGNVPEAVEVLIKYMLKSIKEDSSKLPPAPRTVVRMVKVFQSAGVSGLKYMDGLPNIQRAIVNLKEEQAKLYKKRRFQESVKELTVEKESISSLSEWKRFHSKVEEVLCGFRNFVDKREIERKIEKLQSI